MGVPGGSDDEYRSVEFDESFVRAARLREYSASERLSGTVLAVRTRNPWSRAGAHWQILALVVLIAMAFGTAVYMGLRHPDRPAPPARSSTLRIGLVPLVPRGAVPAATADPLFAADGGARYQVGAAGITLPAVRSTAHFTDGQVLQALTIAKEYLVASSLDEDALTGGDLRGVGDLIAAGQQDQFERSLAEPADDGEHAATGWLVRFDPARIALADPRVRVRGTMTFDERGPGELEVDTDHTLVYSVWAKGSGRRPPPSVFTVRRLLTLRFDRGDLAAHQVEVVRASVEAGPLACTSDPSAYFRPLLAGQTAPPAAGTDPYDRRGPMAPACGVLRTAPAPGRTPAG
jgi:hypothetical protein